MLSLSRGSAGNKPGLCAPIDRYRRGEPDDKTKVLRILKTFVSYQLLLRLFQQFCQMRLCVVEQFDHQLPDVLAKIMVLQRGERQEARPGNDVNTIRCPAKTDEGCVHFPFGR